MSNKFCLNISGDRKIRFEVFPEKAALTVANFKELVEKNFYNGLCFHRVIPGFMIQGGGFSIENNELVHRTCSPIKGEFRSNGVENDLKHTKGTFSMARTRDKNSASSQFFICVADCNYLDGEYAAFGRVLDNESLEAAIEISQLKTGKWMHFDDVPIEPVIIESITKL